MTSTVSTMQGTIIQHRLGYFSPRLERVQHVIISAQQRVYHTEELTCYSSYNFVLSSVCFQSAVVSTFDGYQALIQFSPLAVFGNQIPDDQIDNPFQQSVAPIPKFLIAQPCSK